MVTVSEASLNKWLDERDDAREKLRQLGVLATNLCKENERLKLTLKKFVREWRFGDCDESLLEIGEEICKEAEQLLNPKPAAPTD